MGKEIERNTVLIVDDSEDVRVLMRLKLKKLGHEVIEAKDGIDALEVLKQRSDIKLIIMDIMMPHFSGLETLEKLKSVGNCQDIKVVFLTADKSDDSQMRAMELGAVDFITKPVNSATLKTKIVPYLRDKVA